MKKGRVNAVYDQSYTEAHRTFPTGSTVLLVLIVLAQIALVIFGFSYQPKPQDVIHQYHVNVTPLDDGTLDITYSFVWEALDKSEELSWVEIGMANDNFAVYPESVSPNIDTYTKYSDEGYVTLDLDFKKPYVAGDVFEFSFKINQRDMLCQNASGYFYEFVPSWFNAIRVEQYKFTWSRKGKDDLVQTGSLDYGEYSSMYVQYGKEDFTGCKVCDYFPFDKDGAYNELEEEKAVAAAMCCLGAALLIIAEVYIVDSYVSYSRGRGFLSGYGYHVHTYGRSNPHYIRARDKYNEEHGHHSGGFRGGGGCACACACACAGGGRAGCSQKDTHET